MKISKLYFSFCGVEKQNEAAQENSDVRDVVYDGTQDREIPSSNNADPVTHGSGNSSFSNVTIPASSMRLNTTQNCDSLVSTTHYAIISNLTCL